MSLNKFLYKKIINLLSDYYDSDASYSGYDDSFGTLQSRSEWRKWLNELSLVSWEFHSIITDRVSQHITSNHTLIEINENHEQTRNKYSLYNFDRVHSVHLKQAKNKAIDPYINILLKSQRKHQVLQHLKCDYETSILLKLESNIESLKLFNAISTNLINEEVKINRSFNKLSSLHLCFSEYIKPAKDALNEISLALGNQLINLAVEFSNIRECDSNEKEYSQLFTHSFPVLHRLESFSLIVRCGCIQFNQHFFTDTNSSQFFKDLSKLDLLKSLSINIPEVSIFGSMSVTNIIAANNFKFVDALTDFLFQKEQQPQRYFHQLELKLFLFNSLQPEQVPNLFQYLLQNQRCVVDNLTLYCIPTDLPIKRHLHSLCLHKQYTYSCIKSFDNVDHLTINGGDGVNMLPEIIKNCPLVKSLEGSIFSILSDKDPAYYINGIIESLKINRTLEKLYILDYRRTSIYNCFKLKDEIYNFTKLQDEIDKHPTLINKSNWSFSFPLGKETNYKVISINYLFGNHNNKLL